ncbi:hypothetical protein J6590_000953 [Homalodisca vitripennis]|nr:hypothetical protein J6590_000953 [Homalodisca vitripennis]
MMRRITHETTLCGSGAARSQGIMVIGDSDRILLEKAFQAQSSEPLDLPPSMKSGVRQPPTRSLAFDIPESLAGPGF